MIVGLWVRMGSYYWIFEGKKTGKLLVTSSTIVGWKTCKKKGRKRKKSSHMLTLVTLQNLLWLHQSIPVIKQSYFLTGCEATSARKR